jgi:hypothetical protein
VLILEVEALLKLLKVSEVGLFTWQMLVRRRMERVRDLLLEVVPTTTASPEDNFGDE